MSEDSDFWLNDLDEGPASRAFLAMICAAAWVLCMPFDLCARLRNRANGDPLNEQSGADWGGEHFHNGDL